MSLACLISVAKLTSLFLFLQCFSPTEFVVSCLPHNTTSFRPWDFLPSIYISHETQSPSMKPTLTNLFSVISLLTGMFIKGHTCGLYACLSLEFASGSCHLNHRKQNRNIKLSIFQMGTSFGWLIWYHSLPVNKNYFFTKSDFIPHFTQLT